MIPQDRDGKPLIHIASDGATPISMAEWKQWKKYYKEQARSFYQYQQQQQTQVAVSTPAVAGIYPINSVSYEEHKRNLIQKITENSLVGLFVPLTGVFRPKDNRNTLDFE